MKILYTFSLIPLLRRYVYKGRDILNICLTQVFAIHYIVRSKKYCVTLKQRDTISSVQRQS